MATSRMPDEVNLGSSWNARSSLECASSCIGWIECTQFVFSVTEGLCFQITLSSKWLYWSTGLHHDDVIKWKHFPRYWAFEREIHRLPVNSPHKGQWRGAMMFSLIYTWINGWVNDREAGDLRRHRAHYCVTLMHPLFNWYREWQVWNGSSRFIKTPYIPKNNNNSLCFGRFCCDLVKVRLLISFTVTSYNQSVGPTPMKQFEWIWKNENRKN